MPPVKIGVPREVHVGERRVAITPHNLKALLKLGFEVMVETGAGDEARLPDSAYTAAGATIVTDTAALWADADVVLKIRAPEHHPILDRDEVDLLRDGGTLVSLLFPAANGPLIERLAARKATVIALDAIPRTTIAQKMDVLSSMANIAGYRAVIEAATSYGSFFGGQITAAGKTRPARVLVIGAGVAGLAAIAAARGLGGEVRAFDTRRATKDEVRSLGATFLELEFDESGEGGGGYAKTMSKEFIDAEMALFLAQAAEVDIIITTALVPGRRAPVLVTEDMVKVMKPGSVIVDMAAEQGGNCAVTVPGEVVQRHGVTIIGYLDLTSRLPTHASQFFGSNLAHLLKHMGGAEALRVDMDDDNLRPAVVILDGTVTWPPPKREPPPAPAAPKQAAAVPVTTAPAPPVKPTRKSLQGLVAGAVAAVGLVTAGLFAPPEFLQHFTVFVLACFVGWQVIWNVSPALHTPLMSVTNAISGIIIVGGMLQLGGASGTPGLAAILGAVAVLVASVNIAGGFLVTQRMLQMFHKGQGGSRV